MNWVLVSPVIKGLWVGQKNEMVKIEHLYYDFRSRIYEQINFFIN